MKRVSMVDSVVVTSVTESSFVQIGDTNEIYSYAKAVAVQQLKANYGVEHGKIFDKIFGKEEVPFPLFRDEVVTFTFHERPFIEVGSLRSIGVANGSVLHIGSVYHINAQSYIHHVREMARKEN